MDRKKEPKKKESRRGKERDALQAKGRKKRLQEIRLLWRLAFLLTILILWLMISTAVGGEKWREGKASIGKVREEGEEILLGAEGISFPYLRAEAANAPAGCSEKTLRVSVPLTFPLRANSWYISSGYGWRKHPITKQRRFHQGEDIACAEGSEICAVLDGVVSVARYSRSYGNYIRIRHADGIETLYAHMKYLFVRSGELVHSGQRLGLVGQTGETTGPHLHFELFSDTIRYDPAEALGL